MKTRVSKPLFQRRKLPFHAALWRAARHSRHDLNPFSRRRNGPSPCRQDKRQYNQSRQQHARYKRKRCVQWVRLEMAASLCSPVHRGPHGSLLPTDTIIYPRKARSDAQLLFPALFPAIFMSNFSLSVMGIFHQLRALICQTRSCHSNPPGRSSAANSKWITRRGAGFEEEGEAWSNSGRMSIAPPLATVQVTLGATFQESMSALER